MKVAAPFAGPFGCLGFWVRLFPCFDSIAHGATVVHAFMVDRAAASVDFGRFPRGGTQQMADDA
jgi:hypothetical protein